MASKSSNAEVVAIQSGDAYASANRRTSRRTFLRGAARKAVYMTPVVLTLAASQAKAASLEFDSTCGDGGSPCTVDGDCCGIRTGETMVCGMAGM